MDASEFKEDNFGLLFLKGCSDQFEVEREKVIETQLARARTQAPARERAESPVTYNDTIFVPPRARWAHLRDELHHNFGDGLNNSLAALEETNTSMQGVVHRIAERPICLTSGLIRPRYKNHQRDRTRPQKACVTMRSSARNCQIAS